MNAQQVGEGGGCFFNLSGLPRSGWPFLQPEMG